MSILVWIFKLTIKIAVPGMLAFSINDIYMGTHYHYLYRRNASYASIISLALVGVIELFNLLLDICYIFNIRGIGFINRAVTYFFEEQHTTVYAFFKYGFDEKPISTIIYLAYIGFVITLLIKNMSYAAQNASKEQ